MQIVDLQKGRVNFSANHHLQLLRLKAGLSEDVLPGVEAIGLGYNPFLSYASVDSGAVQLFDWYGARKKNVSFKPGFVVPEIVDAQQNDSARSYTIISGSTIAEYQKNLAISVAIEGKYNFFSGSLSTDYDENSLRNAESEFNRIQQSINLWSLRLPSVKLLRDFMLPHMREQLDELDVMKPEAVSKYFDDVGSHFLTGIVMGGRAILASSTNKLTVKRAYTISGVARVSYEGLTGQLSAEAKAKYGEYISSFTQNSNTHQEVRGGDGTKAQGVFNGREGFQTWVDSVVASPDFVNFGPTTPMQEIWSLCKTDEQADAMKLHYETIWAPAQSEKYRLKPNYIDQLVVITGGSSTIEPPARYVKVPYDLNTGAGGDYIYLCYHEQVWKPDNLQPAVTAIKIIYNQEVTPEGYIKLPHDLNKGAGGEFVYLCYKTDTYSTQNAFNKVTVIGGGNADINAPYGYNKVPGDLNKGAGGEFIYVCTFVGS